ncbi:MAG: hypothetical protein ACRD2O_09510, partial [Terriglobia bacterium]
HRYGLRGTLDLLHHAQREGWVRLQRDHKGIWRVFCLNIPGEPLTPGAEGAFEDRAASDVTTSVEIEESIEVGQAPEPAFEAQQQAELEVEVSEEIKQEADESMEFALAAPEVQGGEAQPGPKPRRKRPARSGSKPARRPARRKPKEPAAE